MSEYITVASQSVEAESNVIFEDTVVDGKCAILHREGSGLVTLRGLTRGQARAIFKVSFGANIAPQCSVYPLSLAIAINGEPIPSTTMISTPYDSDDFNNVFSSVYIEVPTGCCSQISVKNISSQCNKIINVKNANLMIERVA